MTNIQKVLEFFAAMAGLSLDEALSWELLCRLSLSRLLTARKVKDEPVPMVEDETTEEDPDSDPTPDLEPIEERILAAAAADAYYTYCLISSNLTGSFKVGDLSVSGADGAASVESAAKLRDEMLSRCADCLELSSFVFAQM